LFVYFRLTAIINIIKKPLFLKNGRGVPVVTDEAGHVERNESPRSGK